MRFQIIQNRIARRGAHWMRLIGKAVYERARTRPDRFHHARRGEHTAKRRISAGDSLPYQNDIRLDAPMLHRKGFARAAHSRHDFICDQQDAALLADLCDSPGITFGRNRSAERRANHRLENKRRCCLALMLTYKRLEILSARYLALRKSFPERAVIAEAGSDVSPLGNQGSIWRTPRHISADAHLPERAPMIALPPRYHAVALRVAGFHVILADQFDGRFRRFRTARSEINAPAVAEIRGGQREQPRREFLGGLVMELRRVRERDLRGLFRHRVPDFSNAVADAHHRSLARGVQKAAPAFVHNPAAFPTHRHGKRLFEVSGKQSACWHALSGERL